MDIKPDPKVLIDLVRTRMPYGKYQGRLICDIPLAYIVWMRQKDAIPKGKLGDLILNVYEIKSNELGFLFRELKLQYGD